MDEDATGAALRDASIAVRRSYEVRGNGDRVLAKSCSQSSVLRAAGSDPVHQGRDVLGRHARPGAGPVRPGQVWMCLANPAVRAVAVAHRFNQLAAVAVTS
jgi:hypothetical protein